MTSKPRVCRRLFPDEEGIVGVPEEGPSAEDGQRRDSEKWNFDFARCVPLPGNWEWERVGPPPRKDPGTMESIGGGAAEGEAEGPSGAEVGVELNLESAKEGEGAEEGGQEEREEETFTLKIQSDEDYNAQNSRDPSPH